VRGIIEEINIKLRSSAVADSARQLSERLANRKAAETLEDYLKWKPYKVHRTEQKYRG